ncbi:amidase domain-containing protein [Alkalihalobacterium chitinilyticum]|uniref:Amidase domain-containing protein n=1 Tax=Alkalihalobacterium chitinilyticum TaxID=2980103 RepID=A0ABT5VJ16_9BACI|nr:amidase domain-containing protein [Alkalihalobacterium chitinilyticum]MDE5415451.1 amidase domain-containing protein [Alkalihalobacterium chitinilyticum]
MTDQIEQLKRLIEHRNGLYVENVRNDDDVLISEGDKKCLERKLASLQSRDSELVNSTVNAQILGQRTYDDETKIEYVLHLQQSIKQRRNFYIEESIQHRQATFHRSELVDDVELKAQYHEEEVPPNREWMRSVEESEERWSYDRREAVRYAERWWNDYNPAYRRFEDNCTNFISQCLRAGGAPMIGHPNRSNGWWYRNNNWSYSWSVAHSMRWHLSGAKSGVRGKEMSSASELSPGDVICYDFNGNGRWQHTTIVVAKDENGEPLVNAQTTNSRMRYWKYEDSTAWTPNIKYKYFKITDSEKRSGA